MRDPVSTTSSGGASAFPRPVARPAAPDLPAGPGRLARLQQATTLGLVALALAWAWHFSRAGRPLLAAAGALVIVGGYAIVLGLEFVLLRLAHGDDPTPRATPAQLLRAWWGEVHSAPTVFCWRQPFLSRRHPDYLPEDAAGRRGVLLVHGFVCNRGLWNPWLVRLRAAGVPVVAVNLEPVFGSIDDYAARIETGMQRLRECTGVAPVVVAHSMGGLAVRRWWAGVGKVAQEGSQGDPRVQVRGQVRAGTRGAMQGEGPGDGPEGPSEGHSEAGAPHHVITIGTPHHGTWLARFALTPNARQMRRASRWLQALAAREPAGRAARFTCFYSHCDNIVFPPATATLRGADNRHLPGVAHVHMAETREPWEELLHRLQAPEAPASSITPA